MIYEQSCKTIYCIETILENTTVKIGCLGSGKVVCHRSVLNFSTEKLIGNLNFPTEF